MTNGGASLQAERSATASPLAAPGFFTLCTLPSAGGSHGSAWPDASLIAFLNQPGLQVRPTLEQVGGRWCQVVDLPRSPGPRSTLWIDVDRGFLPLRKVNWTPAGTPMADLRVDEVIQLPAGHWVPVRGRTAMGALPEAQTSRPSSLSRSSGMRRASTRSP